MTGDKIHCAGPYSLLQARADAEDLWGYDGVTRGEITRLHPDDKAMVLETYEMDNEAALDRLLDQVEDQAFGHIRNKGEMPTKADFARVDALLDFAAPSRMSITLMIGYLTITCWAKDRLQSRADFVRRVEAQLDVQAPDRKEKLIGGLR